MNIADYHSIDFKISSNPLIYLYGNLGMGKTTLSQHILTQFTVGTTFFPSPTYTYYNIYNENIYHFDLYRLESYEAFVLIGGEEILLNRTGCVIVEWPELIEKGIEPDLKIYIEAGDHDSTRNIRIEFTPQYLS